MAVIRFAMFLMGDSTPLCPKPNMNNMNWLGISRKNFALQKVTISRASV